MIEFVIALIGIALLIGFFGNVFFLRTGIPNSLWLLGFGVVLGALGIIPYELVLGAASLMSALAIIAILSEGGMQLNLRNLASDGGMGILLMLTDLPLSTLTGMIIMHAFGFPVEIGILVGLIVSGTSASVIIPLIRSLNVSEKLRTVTTVESTTDTFSIVLALLLINHLAQGTDVAFSLQGLLQNTAREVSIAILLGVVFGFAWISTTHRLKKFEFSYTATLGALMLLYAFGELVGANGALTVFFAGVMITNAHEIWNRAMPAHPIKPLAAEITQSHALIAFFIRIFFFIFLGLMVGIPKTEYLLIGLLISIGFVLLRIPYLALYHRAGILKISKPEIRLTGFLIARGLGDAVLAVFAFSANIPHRDAVVQTIFSTIIFSILITTLGAYYHKKIAGPNPTPHTPRESTLAPLFID